MNVRSGLSLLVLAFTSALALGVAPDARAHTATLVEGVLTQVVGDPDFAVGGRAVRIPLVNADDGHIVPVDLTDVMPAAGLRSILNKRVRLTGVTTAASVSASASGGGGNGGEHFRASRIEILGGPAASADSISAVTGNQKYVTILCRFAGVATDPRPTSYFATQLSNTYPGFNHYFREASYNTLTLDGSAVAPAWVNLPQPSSFYFEMGKTPSVFLFELFQHCTAAANASVDFSQYYGINMMFNGPVYSTFPQVAAWGGSMGLLLDGVNKSWPLTWMPYLGEGSTFGWRNHGVLAHEMSHSFGSPHSDDPSGYEYGNQWDVVSMPGGTCATAVDANYGCVGQHQVADNKLTMGIIPAARVAQHPAGAATTVYDIERMAQPLLVGGTHQVLKLIVSGTRYYTIESRKRVGYDVNLPADGVLIHEVVSNRPAPPPGEQFPNPARLLVPGGGTGPGLGGAGAAWLPGMTFSNVSENFSVAINSVSGTGTANVTVSAFVPAGPEVFPPDCLMPAGWSTPGGATAGWSVQYDSFAEGLCSIKSDVLANSPAFPQLNKAQIQFAGNFVAGNVTFMRRVSSEAGYDCLQFFVDGVKQNVGSSCTNNGVTGLSGDLAWASVSVPVTAGAHTLVWSYEKDEQVVDGSDAAWIDSVVLPLELGPPTITFAAANHAVNENAGTVTVAVSRGGITADAIGVSWTAGDASAVAGDDYGSLGNSTPPSGTLSWAAGDGAPKNIVIPILQNTALESPETFTLTLSAPTGGASLGATTSATVTVTDDDSIFDLAAATVSVPENGPNVNLTVNRTGSLATSADVTFTTANGTAISGTDYGTTATPPSGVITFGPGVGSRTIAIGPTSVAAPYVRVINDVTVEAPKAFTLALSAPTGGGQLGTTTSATVTLNSDDGAVEMASATASVAENLPAVQVQVNRASSSGAVSVGYTFANGSATNGIHFTGTPGTLNWANGDNTPKFISIPIIDNALVNTARTFTVSLGTPTGAPRGPVFTTTVTIAENDNTLQFTAPTYSANEGALVTVMVSRLGSTANAAAVDYITIDGTAVGGVDFTSTTGTLNWAVGDAATKNFTVQLLSDSLVTGSRNFQVQLLGSVIGATLGTQNLATVTRIDATSGVSFAQPAYTTDEGQLSVSVQVARTGSATAAIGVTWTTGNGSATSGQDFGVAGNVANRTGVLSWLAGDALVKTITIPLLGDTAFEGPETFTINLSAPTGGAALGITPSTTVTINDNESTFQLSAAALNVGEAGPNTTINVVRTGSTSVAQMVTWRATAGTATAISDFNAAMGSLTFAVGESTKTITIGPTAAPAPYIAVVNDALFEGPETFTLALSAPSNGGVLGVPSSALVTIISDERAVSMASAGASFPEGAGAQNLMVARSGLPTGTLTVNYAITNGTALNGTHYTAAGGTLTWLDGDSTSKPIPVTILDDAVTNPSSRTFNVTLSGASAGTSLVAPMATVVTITDNDNTVQFTVPTFIVTEGIAPFTLTLMVSRTGSTAGTADVTWTANSGSAFAGTDFGVALNPALPTGTLHWNIGDAASKPVVIPILNDVIAEGAKTFVVSLSAQAGPNLNIGTNSAVTVTLNDNDAGPRFFPTTYDVTELTNPSVVLTVQRVGPVTMAASATWATVNGAPGPGGAVSGQDFGVAGMPAPRTGIVSWLAGDAVAKTITIPIINDAVGGEGNETFTVVLTPGTGFVAGPPLVATVTIHDDDIPPESTVQFTAPKFVFLENVGNAALTVSRTDLGASVLDSTVKFSTVAGSALATSDYTTVTLGTVSWGVGDFTPKTILIPIANIAPQVAESPEYFKVVLSAPKPGTGFGALTETTVWILDDDELFPAGGAMPAGFSSPALPAKGWHVSNDPGAYVGAFTIKSDEIDDGQTATLEMTGNFAAGNVSFYVKVSTEAGFDKLIFSIDGVQQTTWSGIAVPGWQLSPTYLLSAGAHTLSWVYVKDGSVSVGMDAVYIDSVITPAFTP